MSAAPQLRALPVEKLHTIDELQTVHLALPELASRLNVRPSTIHAWRSKGYGPPAMLLGKHLRWKLSDVIAWEQAQLESPQHSK
ncbi:helix-turn-helix transcriptional regulator [Glutamicibacter nicotianae]|uniref:helix-turn-helix transcriptional regulator n=1 Tax=Glutamicibacter nicotianae TaxID=37929 RepID=UPI0025550BF1|nr:helix-turn-helix domain-containing protein [Glutamicibacter nicotianae]WIV43047.1 helix-turn-helix domain-containing protein [Glutamicibacter nicotianae]